MLFLEHLYLLVGLYTFLILWLPLFFLNKKGRIWMVGMSLLGAILGLPFVQKMYVADWWHPNFIFNSFIKIEDVLFGFGLVGAISSVYSLLKSKDEKLLQKKFLLEQKICITIITFTFFFGLFYIFKIHSFWVTVIGSGMGTVFVAITKPAFLKYAFLTGIFILISILPIYFLGIYLNPEFIRNEWFLSQLSGITFLSIPIEEFIFYISAALGMSAFQELFE